MPGFNKLINEGEKGIYIQETFTKDGVQMDLSSFTVLFKIFDTFGNTILSSPATTTSSGVGIVSYTLDSSVFSDRGRYLYTFDIEGSTEKYLEPIYATLYYKKGIYYTSPDLIAAELNSTTHFTDNTIPDLVTVYNWIDEAMAEIDILSAMTYGSTVESSVYVDYDGSGMLRLPDAPILNLALRYNQNQQSEAASWVDLEEGYGKNYIFYPKEGEIEFINGNLATNLVVPIKGRKKFCITYTHGYQKIPLEIQRLCTLMIAKRSITSLVNYQANSEGGTIQVGTIMISDPTNYSVNYVRDMNTQITDLTDKIGLGFTVFRYTRDYSY